MQERGRSQLGVLVAETQQVTPEEAGAQEQRQSRLDAFVNKARQPRFRQC